MPQVKPEIETFAKIIVVGVGGSGGSAVDRMVRAGIRGVEFMVMNTDVQALHHNSAAQKLHIGKTVTRGLGAGMDPEVGRRSAEESQNEIRDMLKDADMVFVTCGLGGGTGSGAGPVIAQIAKELGALTVGVVTRPFTFEGPQRKNIAERAFQELSRHVDTVITIPNDKVLQIIDKKTPMMEAFKILDDVLRQGVQGISELITVPGQINVDFADVKTIMKEAGSALMGIGVASGEDRAIEAAKAAISSPLLELSIDGARGILFTITGGQDLGMQEVSEAANIITSSADENVKVIFGAIVDETMGDEVRVTVIATGFDEEEDTPSVISRPVEEKPAVFRDKPKRTLFSSSTFKKAEPPPVPKRTPEPVMVEEEDEEEEDFDRGFTSKSVTRTSVAPATAEFAGPQVKRVPLTSQQPQSPQQQAQAKPAAEEDLEIPAFIRKKMGL